AHNYLQSQGHDIGNYKSAVTFTGDSWASYYLQRTLGIPETNRLIRETQIPIWYWRARWFRPLQKEEFRAYLAPDGRVVALSHTLLEDAPGASLSQEEARTLAQDYVSQDRGWDLDEWEEISASSEERPGGRTDHTFKWKRSDWDVGESELRLAVTVKGDAVGGYNYWLKVPEEFQRDFAKQQNVAGFIDDMSFNLSFGLFAFILVLGAWKNRWQISASFSTAVKAALAVGGVVLLAELNELPLAQAWYSTTQDYALFWLQRGIYLVMGAFSNGFMIFMLWFLGQWLSKRVWPRQDRILARRGDRRQVLAQSGWRGLMLGLMMGGYVVIFYLAATQVLGGWMPMGPNYVYAYATPLPFLGALRSGLLPAMWEELMFRLLLISGVLWLTRTFTRLPDVVCRFLALLIPGALWGFAHLSYVRDPFYLRGIELTLAAILLEGLFFLKFDLTTTIVAHFVFNAGLGALPLLRSGEPYFVASGVVIVAAMLAPTLPYVIREALRRLRTETRTVVRPRIRPASGADGESLAALPVEGLDWPALLNDPRAEALCLQAGEEIAGVAAGRITTETKGQILAVHVAPGWRRRYWGSELMDELSARLQERGVESLQAEVSVDDKVSARFISSLGWKRALVTYEWPPGLPTLPSWRDVLKKLKRRAKRRSVEPK
ncbi:MAG: GNAT family N-acetyltransferase, partial [Chloroflexota bacterium]|nr:GNAT family N-acetyltransferase [Chloroflexota bacterium]